MKASVNTLAIKARVANKLRKAFYKQSLSQFTQENKVIIFDALFKDIEEMHNLLNNWKQKRRARFNVEFKRKERGYVPKKKTSLEDYLNMQDMAVSKRDAA